MLPAYINDLLQGVKGACYGSACCATHEKGPFSARFGVDYQGLERLRLHGACAVGGD
jgi:hypothetical protein